MPVKSTKIDCLRGLIRLMVPPKYDIPLRDPKLVPPEGYHMQNAKPATPRNASVV